MVGVAVAGMIDKALAIEQEKNGAAGMSFVFNYSPSLRRCAEHQA